MKVKGCGLVAVIAGLPCLVLAAAQHQALKRNCEKVSKKVAAMRQTADKNARALATAVQAKGVHDGKYSNTMTDYAKDFGGTLPINPCTGTWTGYAMVVLKGGKSAVVCASRGSKCGKWSPREIKLKL